MQQYDVLSAAVTASGVLFTGRGRIKQVTFTGNTSGNASFILYDNPSAGSGKIVFQINAHLSNVPTPIDIPGEGILCQTGCYAALTNVTGITVCYG